VDELAPWHREIVADDRQAGQIRPRHGHKKALGAVKHSILCACWHMLSTGELYRDLGGDYFQRRDPESTAKRLIAQLEALGHTVTLQKVAA
jgi:transposase